MGTYEAAVAPGAEGDGDQPDHGDGGEDRRARPLAAQLGHAAERGEDDDPERPR